MCVSSCVTQQDASTFLPYNGDIKPEKAFEIIEEYKAKVEAVRTTQVMTVTHVHRGMARHLRTHAGFLGYSGLPVRSRSSKQFQLCAKHE